MSKAAARKTTTSDKNVNSDNLSGWTIAIQLMDTSWRVAVPILAFSYIGIQLDKHLHTRPLYSILGLFLALALATFLVYKQIKTLYPEFFKRPDHK
jgi:F0F1-type ATP synthase assembly protein I